MAFGGCGGIGCQINTWGGTCDCLLCAWLTCTAHADCTPGTAEMKEWSFWHCTTCVTDINDINAHNDSHRNISKWTLILFKSLKPEFALCRVRSFWYIKIGCWYMYMSNLIHKWLFTFTTYFKQILHCNVEGLAIFQIIENGRALHVNTSGTYKSTGCIPT